MEVLPSFQFLQANITAMCPPAFGGASGSLLARTVATVIAAHCTIFDDYRWPTDRADDIFTNTERTSYDFIVVGAGTAGSLLAGRLAKLHPEWSILLVEAGGDPALDSEVPAFLFQNQNTESDWQYKTHPDGKTCLGYNDNSCNWSKGKALGGSSSINAMLYLRGHPNDFDNWEKVGNPGWGYRSLKPYFENIERELELPGYEYHENPLYNVIEEAWKELGFNKQETDQDEARVGVRLVKLLIKKGKRLNTAKVYLRKYKNLHVMKNTSVRKIILDEVTKLTRGIEIQRNGIIMQIGVKQEVILSAGSIATPQILMLSGIGPLTHLKEMNIDCLVNLPVGQNLQDHVLLPLFLKTNIKQPLSPETVALFLVQYMLTRTGPIGQVGVIDFMGFIDSKNNSYPDIQFHHTYYPMNDRFALIPYLQSIGLRKEVINSIADLNDDSDILGIFPTIIHPKSKGEVLLADNNPYSKPIIKANYFQDAEDIKILLSAIQFIRKLQDTEAFKALGVELTALPIPDCGKFHSKTDDYWECYIRHLATTTYHPVGTAKLGPKSDVTSVVDHNLLVHGIEGLRVVDASIMPKITSGNTMSPTLVIAEKAVDIIQKAFRIKEEF